MEDVNRELMWAVFAVFAALVLGTLLRMFALRGAAADVAQVRLASLRTWWILAFVGTIAILLGQLGVILLLMAAAILALREYVSLVGKDSLGTSTVYTMFAFVPLYYIAAYRGDAQRVSQMAPVFLVVMIGGLRAVSGVTRDYIRSTGAAIWGLLLFVVALSHVMLLRELPLRTEPAVGPSGWALFLLLLTETNDIMQAIIGRRFGKKRITPKVSPNKSLEGLLGGLCFTVVTAIASAPWLTTLTTDRSFPAGVAVSAAAGILISLAGFLGDINMSAIKRDVGVKDGSRLLPGQGGMIDRIDSLTFAAPMLYYFVRTVQTPLPWWRSS